MIVDSHTHIGRNQSHYSPGNLNITRGDLLQSMDRAGIFQSVVFPIPVRSHLLPEANQECTTSYRFIPFAMVDPISDGKYYGDPYRGLKLHPRAHGYSLEFDTVWNVMNEAKEMGFPVVIHSGWGQGMRELEELARRCRGVNIIVAHMVEPDCLDVVGRNMNMYIDTSYSPHPRRVEQAVSICGEDKVLLGSDYPWGNQELEVMKVDMARISSTTKDKILGQNIMRLIND